MSIDLSREQIRSVFEGQDIHPVCLHLVMSTGLGIDYLFWEPETVVAEIRYTFNTGHSKSFYNKCEAVRTALRSKRTFTEWEVYVPVAIGFSGEFPNFTHLAPPTPVEAVVACSILKILAPKVDFSDEVISTVAACLADDGVVLCTGLPGNICHRVNKKLASLVGDEPQNRTLHAMSSGTRDAQTDLWVYKSRLLAKAVHDDRAFLSKQMNGLGITV